MNDCQDSSGFAKMIRRFLFIALFSVVSLAAAAQGKTVTGTVIDQQGEPVIGCTVLVKGTTNGTSTDLDGKYSLKNVADNASLEFHYVGCLPQTISVKGQSVIDVTMRDDVASLDELVVVGYGAQNSPKWSVAANEPSTR